MRIYDDQRLIERKCIQELVKQNQRYAHNCVNFGFLPTPDITTIPEIPNLIDIVQNVLILPHFKCLYPAHPKFSFPPTQNLFPYLPCFHLLLFSAIELSYSIFIHSCYQKQLSYGNCLLYTSPSPRDS